MARAQQHAFTCRVGQSSKDDADLASHAISQHTCRATSPISTRHAAFPIAWLMIDSLTKPYAGRHTCGQGLQRAFRQRCRAAPISAYLKVVHYVTEKLISFADYVASFFLFDLRRRDFQEALVGYMPADFDSASSSMPGH